MYETWSWHTYSYAFGFVLKTGCDNRLLGRRRLHHHVLLLLCAPCGPPMTPPGLLGSLDPGQLASTLHRLGPSAWTFRSTEPTRVHPSPRSFSVNLSPNLHLALSTAMPHPTFAHHEPRDTSNPHDLSLHILPTYAFLQNLPVLIILVYNQGKWPAAQEFLLPQRHAHQPSSTLKEQS